MRGSKRGRIGAEADRRRLRVLDFPAQRHRDVLRLLCDLRRAGRRRPRAGRAEPELFDLRNAGIETACLLASSFACGLASIAVSVRNKLWFYVAMAVTCLSAVVSGAGAEGIRIAGDARGRPSRSAFLSAFFTLVGCHGLHVSAGILWLLTMMAQVFAKGFRADIERRILCFALFWHALDIIWVALFTVVYLMGASR